MGRFSGRGKPLQSEERSGASIFEADPLYGSYNCKTHILTHTFLATVDEKRH